MWSDNESSFDLFQAEHLAAGIAELVVNPDLLPTTVGVYGDWGSGKSTLINLVRQKLDEGERILTVSFDGWLFEGYDDARSALMGTILDELTKKQNLPAKAKSLISKLQKRVDWFHAAGTVGKVVIPTLVGMPHVGLAMAGHEILSKAETLKPAEYKGLLKNQPTPAKEVRKTIREFRKDFAVLLKHCNIDSLVVFIDDLDRCLPDTVIALLEAIKLFLFVPGTAFIIAADERLVQYAVRQRFPEYPGDSIELGRDYLEKLVQNPVRIPALSTAETESYIGLMFAEKTLSEPDHAKILDHVSKFRASDTRALAFDLRTAKEVFVSVSPELESDLDLTAQIGPILGPGLGGNPRRIKRFLNSLVFRLGQASRRGLDLRRDVLAKLMVLEYVKPEFFRQLSKAQVNEAGRPLALAALEKTFEPRQTNPKSEHPEKPSEFEKASSTSNEESIGLDFAAWISDEWMIRWINLQPRLHDIDLRAYFAIAHDRISLLEQDRLRLSPVAAEALSRLLSPEEVTRGMGLNQLGELSGPDVTGIFEALAQRLRQGSDTDLDALYKVMFEVAEKREEVKSQLIALLTSLPQGRIKATVPLRAFQVFGKGQLEPLAKRLLETWATRDDTAGRASKTALSKWGKGG